MGSMIYLRRDDNKTLFDLGKTHDGLGVAFPVALSVFRVDLISDLATRLLAAWNASDWPKEPCPLEEERDGFVRLAREMLAWAGEEYVALVSEDEADDSMERGYRVTGTRF